MLQMQVDLADILKCTCIRQNGGLSSSSKLENVSDLLMCFAKACIHRAWGMASRAGRAAWNGPTVHPI